jgi:hypothetical protein
LQIAERKNNRLWPLYTKEEENFYNRGCKWVQIYKSRYKWFQTGLTSMPAKNGSTMRFNSTEWGDGMPRQAQCEH